MNHAQNFVRQLDAVRKHSAEMVEMNPVVLDQIVRQQEEIAELRQQLADSQQALRNVHEVWAEREADVKLLRDALLYNKHQCESLRVWGGMEWTYHPFQAKRVVASCEKALVATEPKP